MQNHLTLRLTLTPAIVTAFVLAVGLMVATPTHAVTYQATGIFNDGTSWTATAMFHETAMSDQVVSIMEMDSFTVVTASQGAFSGRTYNKFEDVHPTQSGLVFDGTTSGSNVTGPIPMFGDFFGEYFHAIAPITGDILAMDNAAGILNIIEVIDINGQIHVRGQPFAEPWAFVPTTGAVPEPVSAGLTTLALSSILMSLRRRRAA